MMLIKTRVGPSAIHGLGLFAVEAVARGTPIWRFEPGLDRIFTAAQMAALPEAAREHLRWFGFFSREDGSVTLSGDPSCFMNHSPAPNTGAPPNATAPVTTVARREIAPGEELTCDYFAFDADAARKLGPARAGAVACQPSWLNESKKKPEATAERRGSQQFSF